MKINVEDKEKIVEELNEVEKNCRKRLFDLERIQSAIEFAERKFSELYIPKRAWPGCVLVLEPARVPNAYVRKGRAEGTCVVLERFPSGWFVTAVRRDSCDTTRYGGPPRVRLVLGQDAQAERPGVFIL